MSAERKAQSIGHSGLVAQVLLAAENHIVESGARGDEIASEQPPVDSPAAGSVDRISSGHHLDRLQLTTIQYYIHERNPVNGLIHDKTHPDWPASIAAVGLAMAAFPVLCERHVIPRDLAPEIVLRNLRFLRDSARGRSRMPPATKASIANFWTWTPGDAFGSASSLPSIRPSCSPGC